MYGYTQNLTSNILPSNISPTYNLPSNILTNNNSPSTISKWEMPKFWTLLLKVPTIYALVSFHVSKLEFRDTNSK